MTKNITHFRAKPPTAAQLRAREAQRRAKVRERTARYRTKLQERRCPELRNIAETLLAEFLAQKSKNETVAGLGRRFFERMAQQGFDPAETHRRVLSLRRTLNA